MDKLQFDFQVLGVCMPSLLNGWNPLQELFVSTPFYCYKLEI